MSVRSVLLVAGHMCDARVWAASAHALALHYEVQIAVPGNQPTMQAQAEAILAQAPMKFALAGFSMGGYIALEIMRRQPARVERLALLGTRASADDDEMRAMREARMARVRGGALYEVMEEFARLACGERLWLDQRAATTIRSMFHTQGADTFLAQQSAMLSRPDCMALLERIRCPVTIVCGTHDIISTPDCHAVIAAAIPGASLYQVEGAGHMTPMEASTTVTQCLLGWMQSSRTEHERLSMSPDGK
ncbi:MAG: alpha/beta hydrolase [Pusillimonas sp.]